MWLFLVILLLGGFCGADNVTNETQVLGNLNEDVGNFMDNSSFVDDEVLGDEENSSILDDGGHNNLSSVNESLDIINESFVLTNESFDNESIGDSLVNSSENSSFDFGKNNSGHDYINIDDIISNNSKVGEVSHNKVLKELVKDGKVELEFEVYEGDDIEILKKEVARSDLKKDVLISSDKHFADKVRVYSNLPTPAVKEDIIITWENEDLKVLDVEYFDLDDDGLIERVSWVVPHLSKQYYSIEIVASSLGNSDNLSIVSSVPSGVVPNPVQFNFNIDYVNLSDVSCILYFDSDITGISFDSNGENISKEFSEGSHNWEVDCSSNTNSSIYNSTNGTFNVEDSFSLSMDDFFLKGEESITGSVDANGGIVELDLVLPNSSEVFLQNMSGSFPQNFVVPSSKLGDAGQYSVKAVSYFYDSPAVLESDFDLGEISLDFNSTAETEDVVNIDLKTDLSVSGVYDLYVGSVRVKNDVIFGSGFGGISSSSYTASDEGTFDVEAEITVSGKNYVIDGGSLVVESGVDSDGPDVNLIFPDWEDVIHDNDITFRYDVSEKNGIKNCSFKLYNTKKDSSGVQQTNDLIFPISSYDKTLAIDNDVEDGDEISVKLIDFDENEDYIWEVRCFDDAGNEGLDFNYFSVDVVNGSNKVSTNESYYSRKDEVADLIDKINSFLEKEDSFGLEERRVLDILGLSEDMSFWKKRVVQMDQDLKFNLKYMTQEKREQRIGEIYDEIDEIEGKIVLDVESVDSYEFSKSSLDLELRDVIGKYVGSGGNSVGSSALNSLVKYNEGLQKYLGVDTEVWKLDLEYINGTREIVLVNKNLNIDSDGDFVVLEVLPDGKNPIFVSDVKDMGNNIYSVNPSDLEGGNLVYYFDDGFSLKEVEKMESILFGEGAAKVGFSFSGMAVGLGDGLHSSSFFWLPLFLFFGYFGFFVFGKVKLENLKKEPGVEELVRLINETNSLIREGKVDIARANYNRMNEIYKCLSEKSKEFFYKDIKRICLSIDKKDVLNLIKEYEAAKDSFRRDDAIVLHEKINTIYRKLPKKFQEKVYRRLVKKEV